MSRIASRAWCASSSGVIVDGPRVSPARTTRLVVTSVSQATREYGSAARKASSTVSLIRSATLSGWPSETDSEVKRNSPVSRMNTISRRDGWRPASGGLRQDAWWNGNRALCGGNRRRGQGSASRHAENVHHGIKTRRLRHDPVRRPHRAGGEGPPVEGAMGQYDVLGPGGEDQAVLAHHLAAAQGREADGAGLAGAGMAMAAAFHDLVQQHAAAFCHGPPHRDGSARWRVHFLPMVHLDD